MNNSSKSQIALLSAAGLVVSGIAGLFGFHFYQQYQRHGEAPIKWSWIPFLGFALEMGAKPIKLFQNLKDDYGEIFGMVTLGNRMFIITDPHSYNLIINASPNILSVQEFFYQVEANMFGVKNHISGTNHNHVRAGYSKHLFADSGLARLTQRMQTFLHKSVSNVSSGKFPMHEFLSKLIFHASIAALFNETAGNDAALFPAFTKFDKVLPLACAGLQIKHLSGPWQGRNQLMDTCSHCRTNESDFIGYRWELFDQWMKEGLMTMDDSVAYQVGMLWASVGNTMPAVFWMFYYILSHPQLHERVKDEINRVCVDLEPSDPIPLTKLNSLVLLNACITETLRLTSGSLIMRIVKEPCSLTLASGCSYRFRKGDRIGLCPPLTHLDPEIYPNPQDFNPDRWLVGSNLEELMESSQGRIFLSKGGNEIPSSIAYLPFGGGNSLCPGRKFARNEVKTLVVYLFQRFQVSLDNNNSNGVVVPEFDGSRCGLGIFPPKEDIIVNIQPMKV